MRTIRVTGTGNLNLRPDTSRITMTLEGLFPDYGEALRRSSADTETLRDILSGFGFQRTDLKTISFGVDTEYESCQDDNGVYRQRFAGYRYRHSMKVEFPSDNERLGRVLYALANADVTPELRISYTVKDREALKNTLLGAAVADAREKAAVLARAAGVELGAVQTIDYTLGDVVTDCSPMSRNVLMSKAMADGTYDLNVEPDDISVSDSVSVVWEIV